MDVAPEDEFRSVAAERRSTARGTAGGSIARNDATRSRAQTLGARVSVPRAEGRSDTRFSRLFSRALSEFSRQQLATPRGSRTLERKVGCDIIEMKKEKKEKKGVFFIGSANEGTTPRCK
jgi:hypothetical protein